MAAAFGALRLDAWCNARRSAPLPVQQPSYLHASPLIALCHHETRPLTKRARAGVPRLGQRQHPNVRL